MSRLEDFEDVFSDDEEDEEEKLEGEKSEDNGIIYECFRCPGSKFINCAKLIVHHREYHAVCDRRCMMQGCGYEAKSRSCLQKHLIRFHRQVIGLQEKMVGNPMGHPTPRLSLLDKLNEIGAPEQYKLLDNEHFLVAYDESIKMARWTFEYFQPQDIVRGRLWDLPNFKTDGRIGNKYQLTPAAASYLKKHVGHLAAAQNQMRWEKSYLQSFLMTNTVPMNAEFNKGIWVGVETFIRLHLAKRHDHVCVFTGPILSKSESLDVAGGHSIPKVTGFFKVVLMETAWESPMHQCFVFNDEPNIENMFQPQFRSSLADIKEQTGLSFLEKVDGSVSTWESDVSRTSFFCAPCYKSFQSQQCLDAHVEADHTNFKCTRCRKFCASQSELDHHLVGHKPYQCEYCYYTCVRKSDWIDHVCTHTGERFYHCEHCERSFIQRSTYMEHLDTHNDYHPFVCSKCGQSFRRERALSRHQESPQGCKPGNKKFFCKDCGNGFSRPDALNRHVNGGSCKGRFKIPVP